MLAYVLFFGILLLSERPVQSTFNAFANIYSWFGIEFLAGTLLMTPIFSYLWITIRRGFHNPPTEHTYLVSRLIPAIGLTYSFSGLLIYSAPLWPPYGYEAVMALFPVAIGLLMATAHHMRGLLFEGQ